MSTANYSIEEFRRFLQDKDIGSTEDEIEALIKLRQQSEVE